MHLTRPVRFGSRFGSGRRRRATSHRLEASIDCDDDDDDDSRRGRASGEDDDDETRETRGDDDDGEDDGDAFDGTVGGTSARGTPKLGRRDDDDDANDGDDDASERWTNDHERGPDGERTTRGENRDDRYDAAERDAGFPTRGDARAKLALWTL